MQGRVKFHRKITERERYSDANTFRVFFHLITIANHKDWKRQWIEVKRWQTITGRIELAKQLNLSEMQIRTSLDKLERTGEISKKVTNRYSIITVVKYCDYNDYDLEDNQQITNKQPTDNQQLTTNKNDKNEKEIKKKYGEFENVKLTDIEYDKLQKRFSDYLDKIESLSVYIKSKWDKYKDHYATIIARERKNKPPEPQTQEEYVKVFKEIWLLQFRKKYWQDKANEIMQVAI